MTVKQTRQSSLIFFAIGLAVALSGTPYAIAESPLVIRDLINRGIGHYEDKDYDKAIHEFSKALMVDYDNQEALGYLKKMGLNEGIYGRTQSPLQRVSGLSNQVRDYRARAAALEVEKRRQDEMARQLEEDRTYLQQAIFSKETENEVLRDNMITVQNEADAKARSDQKLIADIAELSDRKTKELARLNDNLYSMKDDMVLKLTHLREKDVEIKKLMDTLHLSQREWKNQELNYGRSIQNLQRSFNEYKHNTIIRDDLRVNEIRKLRDALRNDRGQLRIAKNKILMDQYDIVDKDEEIMRKTRQIGELKATLNELERKLNALEGLEWEGEIIRSAPADIKSDRDDSINARLLSERDKEIEDLQERLARLGGKMDAMAEAGAEDRGREISELKGQLAKLKAQVAEKEERLAVKTSDNEMLQDRLMETKERLVIVENIMEEKEIQIKELEEQLTDMLGDIDENLLDKVLEGSDQ